MLIQERIAEGARLCDVAAELGVHPKTVSRALKRGSAPTGPVGRPRGSKLDPFKPAIDRLLAAGVWNGVVILRELQAQGYVGEVSIVRDYLRPRRSLRPSRATVRFETEPGRQLQHDWAEVETQIGVERRKLYVAVNTLAHSRRFHAWAAPRLDAEHTYESLILAFEYFGGTPAEVLVDNQKAAVIAHRIGQAVVYNARFLDLAEHYGFTPRACRPYRARTKGKDERMVHYVKHHFFVRYRQFDSLAQVNARLRDWLAGEADRRVHGTVKEVVAERFLREAPHLKPLRPERFDTSYRENRFVAWDGYVDVRGNRYSVPHALCGQAVSVRIAVDGGLRILDADDQLVAHHQLISARSGWCTVPEHHAALWATTLKVERRALTAYEEVL